MKLIVHELTSALDQKMEAPAVDTMLYSIRIHIYRHKFPAGTLYVRLLDESKRLISMSDGVLISSIDINGPNNYFHGMVRFILKTPIRAGNEYFVRLTASGYTFSQSAFIGWCTGEEPFIYEHDYLVPTAEKRALHSEAWGLNRALRGA